MDQPAYCTILARNYLPKALSLARSLQRHGSPHPLNIVLIDVESDADLPVIEGVRWMWPEKAGLTKRQVHDFAMSYNLVEFATAVKPLVLGTLLEEFEQVVYLDPDTWVTAPLDDLAPALADGPGGIILTPHYLDPNPGVGGFTEGHLLRVGVFNLGFCGVDRRARDFLSWWWDHLSTECLLDPLAALFVDQKWIDIGATLFDATTLRHYGYNVGVGNLHERTIERDGRGGYDITNVGQPLRLFHFHAFDPDRPDQLYTRSGEDTADMLAGSEALADLARDYGAEVRSCRDLIGPQPAYVYNTDANGRPVTHRLRTAYRSAALPDPGSLPSAFDPADADAFAAWRKQAWKPAGRLMFSDVAKGLRYALPEEYAAVKRKVPGLTKKLRGKYMEKTGMWA